MNKYSTFITELITRRIKALWLLIIYMNYTSTTNYPTTFLSYTTNNEHLNLHLLDRVNWMVYCLLDSDGLAIYSLWIYMDWCGRIYDFIRGFIFWI